MQYLNASWHRFSIDSVGLWSQDGPQNQPQIENDLILDAQGDPKTAHDLPKTFPKRSPNPSKKHLRKKAHLRDDVKPNFLCFRPQNPRFFEIKNEPKQERTN